jgi:hypothetical protein
MSYVVFEAEFPLPKEYLYDIGNSSTVNREAVKASYELQQQHHPE